MTNKYMIINHSRVTFWMVHGASGIHSRSCVLPWSGTYRQISNTSSTLTGNKIVDHSDVVGASPVGAAPTTSSFSTQRLA